jgi:hypothetical protein
MKRTHGRFVAGRALPPKAWLGAADGAPGARDHVVACLVNVTVRQGYNSANADGVVGDGQTICDTVAQRRAHGSLVGDLKADFDTSDDCRGAHLINQAVNELGPALIGSCAIPHAGYRPPAAP